MKILVDCRYLGMSGIGRVCEGIIDHLDYDKNQYFLLGNKEKLKKYTSATIIEDDTKPFSFNALLSFKREYNRQFDAFFTPNYIIPFGVRIPIISIMHDLIFLDIKATTRGVTDRLIKKILLKRGMRKSKRVACVSRFTLNRCKHYYGKLADKCFVNYNGISDNITGFDWSNVKKNEGALVFVGNVKVHKGLQTLTDAYAELDKEKYTLKIIGERENFLTGLDEGSLKLDGVEFTGRLSDKELIEEISKAEFLIQPSFYEGFGLPPLEAICLGTKPIVSDIEVFKEVYEDFPVDFFKVGDKDDLKRAILSANGKIEKLGEKVKEKYNYKNTARLIEEELDKLVCKK